MSNFVKLYGSILYSTVWLEPLPTKVVWITMLALADADGVVAASVPGLAQIAGVTRQECEEAIATLTAPDPDSKTPDFEGRRIEKAETGWLILNHRKYRDLRTESQVRTAERVKAHREKKKVGGVTVTNVTKVTRRNAVKRGVRAEAEEDVDAERSTTSAPSETGVTSNGERPAPWPVEGATIWSEQVAPITPAHFGRAMKLVVDKNGWPDSKAGMECYIELQANRARKVEWYAGESVKYIRLAKMPAVDPVSHELTERGRLALT